MGTHNNVEQIGSSTLDRFDLRHYTISGHVHKEGGHLSLELRRQIQAGDRSLGGPSASV